MLYYRLLCYLILIFLPIVVTQNMSTPIDGKCTVRHGKRLLREGSQIAINKKLFKVENCQLQRAYQTCGPHLWYIVNIVCQAIDSQNGRYSRVSRKRRFAEEKLLSDACCQTSCTVTEMTRYCP